MVLPVVLLIAMQGWSQTVVTGTVSGTEGQPLSGVSILIKGTTTGTSTDANGAFTIGAAQGSTLVFSYVGYNDQEWVVSGPLANITMQAGAQTGLDEVVVVAYGTRRKTDLTGSVTAVTSKDFQKGNIGSSEQLLQGKVAGLEVTTGGGQAGGGSKLRIRSSSSLNASNEPLIVIDGVPVESNGVAGTANLLNTINPNDIESMSVLKDASATALYGSRASNGVIIITTKKGTSGKPQFNFNTRASLSQIGKTVDVLSADEIRRIVGETGNQAFIGMLGTANTDWQKEIYQNAFGWDNNLSVAGRLNLGEDVMLPYRLSGGFYTQEGILKTNKFDRYTTSLNLSPKFLDNHLSLNVNAKYSFTKNIFPDEGAIGNAVNFDPTQPVYRTDKRFGGFYEWVNSNGALNSLSNRNPVALLMLRDARSDVNRFIGNVQGDYKLHFFPDLHVLFNVGMDRSHGSGFERIDSSSARSNLSFNDASGVSRGRYSQYQQTKTSQLADVQLYYEKNLGNGYKVDVLAGHGYQDFYTDDIFYAGTFADGAKDPTQVLIFPDDRNGFAIESYLGRLNLMLADKYLLTASIRRDASSKFSPDNRVGLFPAVAFAWKLKDEFFAGTDVVNDLKLRASWGETGQQDGIAWYSYLPVYGQSGRGADYQFGNDTVTTRRPSAFDPSVRWETTQTLNFGLDYAFAQNRVYGTVDIYRKKTKDLLSIVPIAPGSNFSVELLQNVGNMLNEGVEFTLGLVPVRNGNLTWDLNFNFAANRSEITNLLKFDDPNFKGIVTSGISGGTGNNIGKFAVGYAPYVYFPFKQVYDQTGKPVDGLYEDLDRNGEIDENDRYYYKKPAADFLLGASTSVSVGKFTAGITGHGQIGNYLYNNYLSNTGAINSIMSPTNFIGNVSTNYLNTEFANLRYLTDYYIENASFFRIDNINLGYNFGRIMNDRAALRLFGSIQNVAVISNYKGLDPEVSSVSGVDNNIYPRPRVFSIGADINF